MRTRFQVIRGRHDHVLRTKFCVQAKAPVLRTETVFCVQTFLGLYSKLGCVIFVVFTFFAKKTMLIVENANIGGHILVKSYLFCLVLAFKLIHGRENKREKKTAVRGKGGGEKVKRLDFSLLLG